MSLFLPFHHLTAEQKSEIDAAIGANGFCDWEGAQTGQKYRLYSLGGDFDYYEIRPEPQAAPALPAEETPTISLNGVRLTLAVLAGMAAIIETHGKITVTGAYIDDHAPVSTAALHFLRTKAPNVADFFEALAKAEK
jgi:hypothetical protein